VSGMLAAAMTLGGYVAAWGWFVAVRDSLRWHRSRAPWLLPFGAAGLLCARFPAGWPPASRAAVFVTLVGGAALVYYLAVVVPNDEPKRRKTRQEDARQAALHLVLLTGAVCFALPYAWLVLTSLKPDSSVFSEPASLPREWMWSNYPKTFRFLEMALGHIRTGFGSLFVLNTLQVTALSLTGLIASSTLVAYSFARLRWPGRDALFMVLLGTMMLPTAVTMIPRFLIFKQLGLVDTLVPLWAPSFFAGAFDVFLLRQFLLGIPTDLEDAAKIDGCGYFTIYWRVMLPLIKPAIAALAIMHFLAVWNDFMGPLIYLASPEKMTGSYALRLFQSANSGEWTLLLAASALWTLPVILLFFFAQRSFIQGITLTGMKN
jgi:multiple sugar transport system permease protein